MIRFTLLLSATIVFILASIAGFREHWSEGTYWLLMAFFDVYLIERIAK